MSGQNDTPSDVLSVTTTDYNAARIESEFLAADIETTGELGAFGIQVHQDGGDVALSAGTIGNEEPPKLYSYQALTPSQAREIAEALCEAAERAESAPTGSDATSSESFLRRLLG